MPPLFHKRDRERVPAWLRVPSRERHILRRLLGLQLAPSKLLPPGLVERRRGGCVYALCSGSSGSSIWKHSRRRRNNKLHLRRLPRGQLLPDA